ncbi:hypothetical protein P5F77_10160 [Caldifermentibacillus hisashii]|uniref:Uncharacterized protein n=1 Tax=Caldibacillus thermoamylovorans TaxID=35841 RepID=A0ABD4A3P6_9BACI|nr:hypothetical protein [Caldibacillus thermoamylovorans]KIO60910.1 hypothetical protein B4166_3632 [Caldibacillus thermoamylovorans]KIO71395.1 hypothetical protein B4167_3747 [Caldibacillus thermoamylovorans]
MTTKGILVANLRRKKHYFGDETPSRRQFGAGNAVFWRRDRISSPI